MHNIGLTLSVDLDTSWVPGGLNLSAPETKAILSLIEAILLIRDQQAMYEPVPKISTGESLPG
jgi:hypothetical protein